MSKTYTIAEFAKHNNFSDEYARQMCRKQVVTTKSGKYRLELPAGWSAERKQGRWVLTYQNPETKPKKKAKN